MILVNVDMPSSCALCPMFNTIWKECKALSDGKQRDINIFFDRPETCPIMAEIPNNSNKTEIMKRMISIRENWKGVLE